MAKAAAGRKNFCSDKESAAGNTSRIVKAFDTVRAKIILPAAAFAAPGAA